VSLAESFLKTAKDMLMMSENIKRLDAQIDRMADGMSGLDRRLMRIEVLIDLTKGGAPKRSRPELP